MIGLGLSITLLCRVNTTLDQSIMELGASLLTLPLRLLLTEQLSSDATSFCRFSFFSEFRILHLLAILNACKRRDSCKYGFRGTVLQSKKIK